MFSKRTYLVLISSLILAVSSATLIQAAPPWQEYGSVTTLGETLDLDSEAEAGGNNPGAIMSGLQETDPDSDDDDNPDPDDGSQPHPVASAMAAYFEVPYDKVMELHLNGNNGFGAIAKAFFFSNRLGGSLTPEELLDAAHSRGWGNALKENGIHPGSVGKGAAKKAAQDGPPGLKKNFKDGQPPGKSQGNGKGPGNSQGNGKDGEE